MMHWDEEVWIKVYTRDTGAWVALSWQARGLALEIARKLPRATGEISLGRRGLESLALLLRANWKEIEPFVRELLDDGRLEYDEETGILSDPQHVARQTAVASDAIRQRESRARKRSTPRTKSAPPLEASRSDVTESHVDVTSCDTRHADVTPRHADVTPRHADVTPRHADVTPRHEGVTPRHEGVTPVTIRREEKEEKEEKGERDAHADARGPTPPSATAELPEWFRQTVATIEMTTAERLDAPLAWLRYHGHRMAKGKPPSPPDASYWLSTVIVPEMREARERDRRRRELDQLRRSPGDPPPKPQLTPEEAKENARKLSALLLGPRRAEAGS